MSLRKTNNALYEKYHRHVREKVGKASFCSFCNCASSKRYEWALIKGRSYSSDPSDYIALCKSCHAKYDVTDETRRKVSEYQKSLPKEYLVDRAMRHLKGWHRKGADHIESKGLVQLKKRTGEFVKEWGCLSDAARFYGVTPTAICNSINGRSLSCKGFWWVFSDDYNNTPLDVIIQSKNTNRPSVDGKWRSSEWGAWSRMKQACYNPRHVRYKNVGGKGITVCAEWMSFKGFCMDMGSKPSPRHYLVRIDPARGFMPGNCTWRDTTQINQRLKNVFSSSLASHTCTPK